MTINYFVKFKIVQKILNLLCFTGHILQRKCFKFAWV